MNFERSLGGNENKCSVRFSVSLSLECNLDVVHKSILVMHNKLG